MQQLPQADNLPLFNWHEIDVIQKQRQALRERIDRMRPNSHRRVELTARLRTLTTQQIALQLKMKAER
ncbi:hypothetical protein JF546_09730 [Nitratireductor aquimarinus]|uniref:hypothetical protein n=1 Tax=Nitratireductor aquimarinus TaxID=889300 RepID=UPI001A8D202B|nr:hypothetical protein [Nitratireductor aquimarinus]MBN8243289.1 hypothetical protein [Nitratireductor aquimarinus]MBY6131190.1 hypothetical protein [Nitratireductor aquimarinus]MCA1302054.1 hypothetical protein [Nitratireductor aquimarinus]